MPTRKEILEALAENLDDLSDRMGESSDRYRDAADRHGKSIEKAGSDFVAGLVGGAAVLAGGMIVGGVLRIFWDLLGVLKERAEEIQKKIQMIESIIAIKKIRPHGL
ncbi:hypothetical protein [Breoghania sp. L-A4]|uniref:hypothetical protein n=1 Tax=Breoghania sp. L-A4 TaxID=2304600 RepID=UPI000E35DF40|nr:hypothetical protein [Breoghania sp. L-A4]AXS40187.1 hypothetical protein D1F64_09100 [Breoghania sp. L-A4]